MEYVWMVLGLGILLFGGKLLVDGASAVASKIGLSAGLIGLTVVAFGTSAPELLVSITAALKGTSDIAVGNVVGSNISNITLVLGITALVYPVIITRSTLRLDYAFTLITSLLFFVLALDGNIGLWEGMLLVALLFVVNFYFFKKIGRVEMSEEENASLKKKSLLPAILLLLVGTVGLYVGSELLVENGINIAQKLGVSERIIGVTIIAVGTSLPELATSVIAAIKKETDIAIGNILGSNMMNVLSIIGITAIVKPIDVSTEFLRVDFLWMLGMTALLFPLMRWNYKISRWAGMLLLLTYASYIYLIL
ncbi:calcium/sodium antiporter [Pleomorphovibrio marinus]|uniref:calcium/sodium antiporter n=1 Tax=Pleomorphovibrio marinus TaxID=2164132 RepID=UPI000E0ADA73|nr:calcium/sodium antiporter [Pleomorphovibrio marinus]